MQCIINISFEQATRSNITDMNFNPKLKELARGDDAVDRLREIQRERVERRAAALARFDMFLRTVALAVLGWLVLYAYTRL